MIYVYLLLFEFCPLCIYFLFQKRKKSKIKQIGLTGIKEKSWQDLGLRHWPPA